MFRTLSLIFASISFIVIIGGATYEHLAVVPAWSAAPPASLTMFQGDHALAAEKFWISIHPITIILLIAAWGLNRSTARSAFILAPLIGYAVILAITALYFVPELQAIIHSPYSAIVDPELTRRAQTWELLSIVRLLVLFGLAVTLLFGLSRPSGPNVRE